MSINDVAVNAGQEGSKKPLVSTLTAVFIGAFGFYKIDQHFLTVHRYPVSVEYEIIDACVNANRSLMSTEQYKRKKEICSCALVRTQEDFPFKEMRKDASGLTSRLREHSKSC